MRFWERMGQDEDTQSLDAKIQSRYDSLQETTALRTAPVASSKRSSKKAGRRKKNKETTITRGGGEVELAELNEPLVRRTPRVVNNIV